MAEPSELVSIIQEVIDGRVDLQSFEEFMNAAKDVVIARRLAGGVNSLDHYLDYFNAIKLVFTQESGSVTVGDKTVKSLSQMMLDAAITIEKNGGHVPYPTYGAMVAAKADITNKMILEVTNDTDQTKNGKYTYDGVSVFTKSNYDIVAIARNNSIALDEVLRADLKEDVANLNRSQGYAWQKIGLGTTTNGYITNQGVFTADEHFITSDYIPVTKGDVFIVEGYPRNTDGLNVVTLFDQGKLFVGSIGRGSSNLQPNSPKDERLRGGLGAFSTNTALGNIAVIVPQDGFIRANFRSDLATRLKLIKTEYRGLVENSLIQLDKTNMMQFKGVLHSIIRDSAITAGGIDTSGAVVGSPLQFKNTASLVSRKYPVKQGDYIQLMVSSATILDVIMSVEDAAGNFLGVIEEYTNRTLSSANEGRFYVNCACNFTGFLRVQYDDQKNVPALIAITDKKIAIKETYLENNTDILFFEKGVSKLSGLQTTTLAAATWADFAQDSTGPLEDATCRSKPYLLKKGQVLEYGVAATIDATMFMAIPNRYRGGIVQGSDPAFLPVNATDIFDLETKGIPFASDSVNNSVWVGKAVRGKAVYCNEYEDTIIVFFRPSRQSARYALYECNDAYEYNIYSKAEYIEKRDKELVARFKSLSGFVTDTATKILAPAITSSLASYAPVFLFRGEILNCLTGGNTAVKGTRLRNPNKPSELATRVPIYTGKSIYQTARPSGFNHLPISLADANSYNHAQVYAQENCIVYVCFSALAADRTTLLDSEKLIKNSYFKPRIVHIDNAVVGDNIIPTLIRARRLAFVPATPQAAGYALFSNSQETDLYATFARKGSYLEYSRLVLSGDDRALCAPIANSEKANSGVGYPASDDFRALRTNEGATKGAGFSAGFRITPALIADELPEDLLIFVNVGTRFRSGTTVNTIDGYVPAEINKVKVDPSEPSNYIIDAHKKALAGYSPFVRNIPREDFNYSYRVTEDTYIHIEDSNGICFNFCEVVSASMDIEYQSVLQIKRGDKILAVVNTRTKNQGQSSQYSDRKNINVKFYNSKGKKLIMRFDESFPESTYVLKSYITTDRGMFKDALTSDTWSDIRNVELYPEGGVFPKAAFSDTRFPRNQMARGTTFGFPTEVYFGGVFFSLAGFRNKKDSGNYAMQEDNHKHILMQPETSPLGPFSWSTFQIGNFEVRNPDMEGAGYTQTNETLPAGYEDTTGDINRFLIWARGIQAKTIDFVSTYENFIDLDSFIDYGIAVNVTTHWDSQNNNFLLGTHDGKIWRAYLYDADQSWGSRGASETVLRNPLTLTQDSMFKTIQEVMVVEVRARYKKLREAGVLNVKKHKKEILRYYNRIRPEARLLDIYIWGALPYPSTAPYVMDFISTRIDALDIYYKYEDPKHIAVIVRTIRVDNILAGEKRNVSHIGTNAKVGDLLSIELEFPTQDVEVTYNIPTNGTVIVSFENKGLTTVTTAVGYLRVVKQS